jgi:hypothetical protein
MAKPLDDITAIRTALRALAKLDPQARLAAARFILARVEREAREADREPAKAPPAALCSHPREDDDG